MEVEIAASEIAGMLLNLNCPLKWINDFSNQSLKRTINPPCTCVIFQIRCAIALLESKIFHSKVRFSSKSSKGLVWLISRLSLNRDVEGSILVKAAASTPLSQAKNTNCCNATLLVSDFYQSKGRGNEKK